MLNLLFRGGRVVDGTGNPWFHGDVGIDEGRIEFVGRADPDLQAERIIDAAGLVVAPGFIDMHAHSDLALLAEPEHLAKVAQGVTTEVIGQDGLSYAPVDTATLADLADRLRGWNGRPGLDWSWRSVGEFLDRFRGAVNVVYLVPHGTVRLLVVGDEARPASPAELEGMAAAVAEGMDAGAAGLSTGLSYAPAMYADDTELEALCRVVASRGGYYSPHHRNYGSHALESYAACIEVGERTGVPVHLTHAHLGYPINRGRAPELLDLVDDTRARGVEVTLDSYPYLAAATYLHAFLPGWAQEGGLEATLARLRSPDARNRIRREIEHDGTDGSQGVAIDWSTIVLAGVSAPGNAHLVGVDLAAAAAACGTEPFDLYCDLLVGERLAASCLMHIGNEENVRTIMRHPAHMAGSDGLLHGDRPHPRAFGTFPRYLGRYVRELGLVPLQEMVRKMTSLPARRIGLTDRGLLSAGMVADIVCFDPDAVADTATYESPKQTPIGIPYVLVAGSLVIDGGEHTGALPGRALRPR